MYKYEELKPQLFTEEGQVKFLGIRDNVNKLLNTAGAVRLQEAIRGASGDSWLMLACVDRLVELGEIKEVTENLNVAGQHRVFVSNKVW